MLSAGWENTALPSRWTTGCVCGGAERGRSHAGVIISSVLYEHYITSSFDPYACTWDARETSKISGAASGTIIALLFNLSSPHSTPALIGIKATFSARSAHIRITNAILGKNLRSKQCLRPYMIDSASMLTFALPLNKPRHEVFFDTRRFGKALFRRGRSSEFSMLKISNMPADCPHWACPERWFIYPRTHTTTSH